MSQHSVHAATQPLAHPPAAVAAAYRRVSRRIVPLLFAAWVIAYMDNLNVGFAQLQMKQDLGLSDAAYGIGASLVLLANILFQVPSNLLMERIGARPTFARIMLAWFAASVAMAFVHTPAQFLVLRFLTGMCAAGLWTAILLYVTYWFPSGRRAGVLSVFVLAPVVAGIVVGPVSGWILSDFHESLGLRGWQWMFLLEGVPALAMAAIVVLGLPERPRQAAWLTATEREIIEHNLEEDRRAMPGGGVSDFSAALRDRRIYVLGFVNGAASFAIYCMTFFMPIMIEDLGVKDLRQVGFYSAIPWIVGGISMVLYARSSDRRLERRWHYLGAVSIAAAGFAIVALTDGVLAGIVGITLVITGLSCTIPVFWPIPAAFLTGPAAAGGLAVVNAMGDLGGMTSPTIVGLVRTAAGSLDGALLPIAAAILATAVLMMRVFPAGSLHERRPD